MNGWDFATYWITRFDWMILFGIVLSVGAIVIFWTMARNRHSRFDFSEMFLGEDGKTSLAKFGAFLAMLATTWIVVALAVKTERLSGEMFLAYIGALVAGKVASEFVAAKKVVEREKVSAGISDPATAPPGDTQMDLKMNVSTTPAVPAQRGPRRPLGKE